MATFRQLAVRFVRQRARASSSVAVHPTLRKAYINWRYPDGPDVLVRSPVFLFSPVRSGSTLLRVILDSHSQICAPHELHLNRLKVSAKPTYLRKSLRELGTSTAELENILWDRVMHRQLVAARKSVYVDKTPQNLAVWPRISEAWPGARYLFLMRNPASIVRSLVEAKPDISVGDHQRWVLLYGQQLEDARHNLPGLTVRYEDLVASPEAVTRSICSWLGVRWERSMLDYGQSAHGRYVRGIGDWSDNIRSGTIQPARPAPGDEITTPELRQLMTTWGY